MVIFKAPEMQEDIENNKKIDELLAYFLSVDINDPDMDDATRAYIQKIKKTVEKYNR